MEQQVGQAFRFREFRGYALNFAARLEASHPHTIIRLLQASSQSRQGFFATSAEVDLDCPDVFLGKIKKRAPDVLADLGHLDADSDVKPAGIPINIRPPFRFEAGHDSNQLPAGFRH
jgi:hypothetical protein